MKKKYMIFGLLVVTIFLLSSCILRNIHKFNIIEGVYQQENSEELDIKIIENQDYKITDISVEFKKISEEVYEELNGINTIQDLSKSLEKRTYFMILIYLTVDGSNVSLNIKNVRKFANAKDMYRMDFDFDLANGMIELYIYENHIRIGFHLFPGTVKLIREVK